MSRLEEMLRHLDVAHVQELVLQSGSPIAVRTSTEMRALTRTAVTLEQLTAFLADTPLAPLVPASDASNEERTFSAGGRKYRALFSRSGARLQVRLRHAAPEARNDGSGIEIARTDARADGADRQLTGLLVRARQANASDVHVVSEHRASVRRAGQLVALGQPVPDEAVRAMILPLLDERARSALDTVGYADFALELPEAGRLRVNVCRQRTGLKACFRLVAKEPPTLEQLGLPEAVSRITRYHQGLVVVSGPTGHGKTTTMAALIDLFNRERPLHIVTVEDPVEIIHPPKRSVITQRQVGKHTTSFARALKASLREDPDIIAIGELRDRETVEMALSAAETGHLVITTMSTPSGARTIDRLIDMFPPDDQQQVRATLAGALKLVVSQRLVPSADGARLHAATEIITGSVPLWSLIRDNKLYQLPSLLQRGKAFGMIRVEDSLRGLVARRLVTPEVAAQYADDPRALTGGP